MQSTHTCTRFTDLSQQVGGPQGLGVAPLKSEKEMVISFFICLSDVTAVLNIILKAFSLKLKSKMYHKR